MSRRRALLLLAAPVALVGCSNSGSTSLPPGVGASQPPVPIYTAPVTAGPCALVFAPGRVVSAALQAKGCTEANGGTLLVTVRPCADGGHLAASGDVFGVVGKVAVAGGLNSPAYTQAYNRCSGLVPVAPPPR